jgi:uncharacterized membrane protein
MFGLTPLGQWHTAISLVALVSGIMCLFGAQRITLSRRSGQVYVMATLLSCLTAFGIFQHGGFGKPHVLAVMTLIALGLGVIAENTAWLGRAAWRTAVIAYSTTFFFHLIPGLTETGTRLPQGAPLFSSPEDPKLQAITGVLALLFVIGLVVQLRSLRKLQH